MSEECRVYYSDGKTLKRVIPKRSYRDIIEKPVAEERGLVNASLREQVRRGAMNGGAGRPKKDTKDTSENQCL